MTDPLATIDDLEARLGEAVTDPAKATALLTDASAAVRDASGQTISEATTTDWLKVRRGFVRIPQRPVTAVSAVEDENSNSVTFTWIDGTDKVRLDYVSAINAFELEPYRNALGLVAVTSTHGYAEGAIPDLIVAIVCSVTLRAMGRDPRDGGVSGETIEGYSYQIGSTGAAGPVGLLPEEKLRLESFLRPHGYSYAGV